MTNIETAPAERDLRDLLATATLEDLERVVAALDRWPRPTRAAVSLALARTDTARRPELEDDIVREITRCASAPLTRAARRAARRPPRDELHEVITEASKRLNVSVRVPIGGTLRGRLASMAGALVDRAVLAMPPEEQQRLGIDALDRIEPRTNAREIARAVALPAIHRALGPAALAKVIEAVILQTTSIFLGQQVARAMLGGALARLPALGAAFGPLAWGASAGMVAWEIQKPAYRKLVPALVCLGFVALRSRTAPSPLLSA